MTDLQMGLIGLGGAAVLGVIVYNKWQERRHRKLAEQLLRPPEGEVDILLETGELAAPGFAATGQAVASTEVHERHERTSPGMRIEPMLRAESGEAPGHQGGLPDFSPASDARDQADFSDILDISEPLPPDPVRLPEPSPERHAEPLRESPLPLYLLSSAIDYIAAFDAVEPAPAYQILQSQRDMLARIRKPLHWVAYNELRREWEPVFDDGKAEYRRLCVGLQLVDRQGPARDADLSTFHLAMQNLADELMAIVELPPRQPALDLAMQLDQFCADVDIQIGINVISQGHVFQGTKLRALAEAAGMSLDLDGRFVRFDDEGNPLYLLTNMEATAFSADAMKSLSTHGITFLLDVPRLAHGERVFNQMIEQARRFAESLHGVLVDDNRQPLPDSALDPIRRQVTQYQAAMASRNIPAGGPLALRLFS